MKKLILIVGVFMLYSCAPNYIALMKNPQTGDVKECKRNPLKNWTWEEWTVVEECARLYEKAGYERVK